MPNVLEALRAALEHEITLYGPTPPLGPPVARPAPNPSTPPPPVITPTKEATETATQTSARATPEATRQSHPPSAPTSSQADPAMPSTNLFGEALDPSTDPALMPWDRVHALIPEGSPLHAMTTLQEVEAYATNTILVPIDQQRKNAVFGVGNPEADLMVIGEAPGADEDRLGEPFVGRAGQLLDKILAAIDFQRSDLYIANILKSRPPNNRDPLAAEVEAHIPLLYKQIALIKPQLILAVGRTAGNGLLGRSSSLKALRGTFHDYHGIPLMVTYHPAALLRNPQWKRPTWEDVQLLRARYDELTQGS